MKRGLLPLQTLPRPLLRRLKARRLLHVNAAAWVQLSPPNTSNNNAVLRQTPDASAAPRRLPRVLRRLLLCHPPLCHPPLCCLIPFFLPFNRAAQPQLLIPLPYPPILLLTDLPFHRR